VRARLLLVPAAAAAVAAVLWLVFIPGPDETGPAGPQPSVPSRNVLMIGLDGADWDIVDPMIARGELPNIARLASGGARARLRTVAPILSPVVWTSIATGKRPEKHGIFDFLARAGDGSMVPVTSTLWQARPLWSILGEAGVPVAVTAWWATWPAEELHGYMATDRIAYQLFRHVLAEEPAGTAGEPEARGKTWPPELFEEVAPRIVPPESIGTDDLAGYVDLEALGEPDEDDRERMEELRTAVASTRTYEAIGHLLLDKQPGGFHSVYNESTDTVAHLFMPFRPPAMEGTDARRARAFGGVVDGSYREADAMIGRLLERIDEEWNVIVLSDHGFKHGANRPSSDSRVTKGAGADWHDRFGILILWGPDILPGVRISDATILDVAPTLLTLYGLPVAEDMDGRVLREALHPAFLEEHPVASITTWEKEARTPAVVEPSDQDADLVEKLKALGYVDGDTEYSLDNARAYNNRGIALMAAGDMVGALEEFEKGLEAGGGVQSLLNIANLHLAREDVDEAERVILRMQREYPGFRNLPALQARLADLRGDTAGAERYLLEAIRVDPADSRSLTRLGHLKEKSGRPEEALALYRRAVEANPENAEASNYIGNILRERGDLAGAERAYRNSVEADPKYAGGCNNLGLLLQQTGRPDEAVALYRKGLEEAPDSALLHNSLCSLLMVKGELDEAESSVRRALEIEPGMAEALNNLGIIQALRGRNEASLESFEKAVRADPGMADAHFNLAKASLIRKDFEHALDHFRKASDLDPAHLDAALGAGETAFRMGRRDDALRYFRRANALRPGIPRVEARLKELR
jgi:tetratricopeptide (TPR) repeat protein/predicted AlkP superfamily phosphohydrolase/phosphomutase